MDSDHDPGAGLRPETVAVRAGRGAGAPGDPHSIPVTLTSTYEPGEEPPEYARERNPTWEALEETLGALEGGQATVFASGMAAVDAVLGLVPDQAAVVAPADGYTGTRALLADAGARGRLRPRLVDIADTDTVLAACDGARMLWVESPTNPLLAVPDVRALSAGAHERGLLVAVDNTFATPLRQRPLDLGADVAVHSVTKAMSGHADVLMGAAITRDAETTARLVDYRTTRGAVPGPMEAWLALRGLRTLPVRLDRAEATAGALASRLLRHPAVVRVCYPGLPDDPGHGRARSQMRGFGAVLSIVLADEVEADAFCRAVRVAVHATSLGGVQTSLERRGRQPREEHLPSGLVRISVGLEDPDDLWSDLAHALAAAVGTAGTAGAPSGLP